MVKEKWPALSVRVLKESVDDRCSVTVAAARGLPAASTNFPLTGLPWPMARKQVKESSRQRRRRESMKN